MNIAVYIMASLFYWGFALYFLGGVYFMITGDESLKFQWDDDESVMGKVIVSIFVLACIALPVLFIIGTINYF